VIRKAFFQNRITVKQGSELLNTSLSHPITFIEDDALLKRAFEFADQYGQPRTYDTQYITLAERLKCEFWTTDQTLVNSLQQKPPM